MRRIATIYARFTLIAALTLAGTKLLLCFVAWEAPGFFDVVNFTFLRTSMALAAGFLVYAMIFHKGNMK